MIDPSTLSWAVVIFIFLSGMLNTNPEDFDDDN